MEFKAKSIAILAPLKELGVKIILSDGLSFIYDLNQDINFDIVKEHKLQDIVKNYSLLLKSKNPIYLEHKADQNYAALLLEHNYFAIIGPIVPSQTETAKDNFQLLSSSINAIIKTIYLGLKLNLEYKSSEVEEIESNNSLCYLPHVDEANHIVFEVLNLISKDKHKILSSKGEIIKKLWPMHVAHNTYAYEVKFLQAISDGEVEQALRAIKQPMHGKEGRMGFSVLRHAKNSTNICATLSARAAMRGGIQAESAYSLADYIILRSELCSSIEEAINLREECVLAFALLVKLGKRTSLHQYSVMVQKVLEEIERVLFNDVKRQDIVLSVERNADYVERVFKKEVGISIMAYLRKRRIETAADLLLSSNRKLGELASLLQFSSTAHFSKVFTNIMGISPLEYQKKYLRGYKVSVPF